MEEYEYILGTKVEDTNSIGQQAKQSYKEIKQSIKRLQQIEAEKQQKFINAFLKTFQNLMTKIGNDVQTAKQKYQKIDKQQLIDNRLLELAKNINFFRQTTNKLNKQVEIIDSSYSMMRNKNSLLQFQNQCMRKLIKRNKSGKNIQKQVFFTEVNSGVNSGKEITFQKVSYPSQPSYQGMQKTKALLSFEKIRIQNQSTQASGKRMNYHIKRSDRILNKSAKFSDGFVLKE